jgi:hypothetical protein
MNCIKCGHTLIEEGKFCSECGEKVVLYDIDYYKKGFIEIVEFYEDSDDSDVCSSLQIFFTNLIRTIMEDREIVLAESCRRIVNASDAFKDVMVNVKCKI